MNVNQGTFFTINYQATVEVQYTTIKEKALLRSIPIIEMDTEVLPYLFPSRHCQAIKLTNLTTKLFGHLTEAYYKVVAITDWIFYNIDYRTVTTDFGTAALDTLAQREDFCKDFAHLGIALCRALDIPARYFTGYACNLNPPDFHACFEAYIGGQWIFLYPTRSVPINGLIKIANGKDATERAVASFFGNTNCTFMNMQCNAADDKLIPYITTTGKVAVFYQ